MPLISPAPGHPLTQGFSGHYISEGPGWIDPSSTKGKRSSFAPSTYNAHDHLALDYACPVGTKLIAPQSGIIVAEGRIAYFPNGTVDGEIYQIVRVRKSTTYQTLYLLTHLTKSLLPVGSRVRQGEPIALSGASGHVTGPHVHFELALIPPNLIPTNFWNKQYYRYDPASFYAGGYQPNSLLVVPNV